MKFNRHPVFWIIGQLKDVVIKINFYSNGGREKAVQKITRIEKINDKNKNYFKF